MTRLDSLVLAIAPAALAKTIFAPEGYYDAERVAQDIVTCAIALDRAIADYELSQLKEANRGPRNPQSVAGSI